MSRSTAQKDQRQRNDPSVMDIVTLPLLSCSSSFRSLRTPYSVKMSHLVPVALPLKHIDQLCVGLVHWLRSLVLEINGLLQIIGERNELFFLKFATGETDSDTCARSVLNKVSGLCWDAFARERMLAASRQAGVQYVLRDRASPDRNTYDR